MTTETDTDALYIAREDLQAAMVPTPDDLLGDVGPLAVLWYVREAAHHAVATWTAQLTDGAAADVDDDSEPVRAHAALLQAAGMLDMACELVSLLPPGYTDAAPDVAP